MVIIVTHLNFIRYQIDLHIELKIDALVHCAKSLYLNFTLSLSEHPLCLADAVLSKLLLYRGSVQRSHVVLLLVQNTDQCIIYLSLFQFDNLPAPWHRRVEIQSYKVTDLHSGGQIRYDVDASAILSIQR